MQTFEHKKYPSRGEKSSKINKDFFLYSQNLITFAVLYTKQTNRTVRNNTAHKKDKTQSIKL